MATNLPAGLAWSHRRAAFCAQATSVLAGSWLLVAVNPSIADSTLATGAGPLRASAHVNFRIVIPRSLRLDVRPAAGTDGPSSPANPAPSAGSAVGGALTAHIFGNTGSVVATSSDLAFQDVGAAATGSTPSSGATTAAKTLAATRNVVRQSTVWAYDVHDPSSGAVARPAASRLIYTVQSP